MFILTIVIVFRGVHGKREREIIASETDNAIKIIMTKRATLTLVTKLNTIVVKLDRFTIEVVSLHTWVTDRKSVV